MSEQDPLRRNFTHLTIPAEIWLRRDISINAKALWAELRSLHCNTAGGCYASEEYLCDFMQLKPRRVQGLLAELKEKGLIETVSFNGRRVIRKAIVPEVEYVSAEQGCKKVRTSSAEKCGPVPHFSAPHPLYREERIESPPIPPDFEEARKSDKSSEKRNSKFSKLQCSDQVLSISDKMIGMMKAIKPDYKPPKALNNFHESIDLMLRVDERSEGRILAVFAWAIADPFWCDKFFKPNPAKYLRDKFDQLDIKLNPPKPKKDPKPQQEPEPEFDAEWIERLKQNKEKYARRSD